jgi:uncharacterized protein
VLRALLRIAAQALLMIALGALPVLFVAEPLTGLHKRGLFLAGYGHDDYDQAVNILIGPLLVLAVLGSIAIAARWLDKRPLRDFGLVVDRAWWTSLALGFAIGALVMTLVFAVEYAAGWVEIRGTSLAPLALAYSVVKALCVGTYEELLSRGYQLRNLIDASNVPAAVAITSAVFALLHAFTDNASAMSTAGLFVNGVLFAVAVLATGRMSAAIGLHIAWNLFEGTVFGFAVSGDKEAASLIAIRQLGPDVVTGGAYGPEAGLIGIAASLVGIVGVWRITGSPAPPTA